MTNKNELENLFSLVISGVITSLMVLPFTFALIELPEDIPLALIVIAQTVQVTIILSACCFIGLKLLRKTNLKGLPLFDTFFNRENPRTNLKSLIQEAVILGIAGGVLTVLLCIPFWDLSVQLLIDEMNVGLWKSILACFYGGIGEEIIFRLGMMTFFVWLFQKYKLKNVANWLAIIITGVIFGLGHIGITSSLTTITFDVVLRAVLLNGSLSVIYGILYWKRGLESAMIAHFSTDVVLHIVIPYLIAPFFI